MLYQYNTFEKSKAVLPCQSDSKRSEDAPGGWLEGYRYALSVSLSLYRVSGKLELKPAGLAGVGLNVSTQGVCLFPETALATIIT